MKKNEQNIRNVLDNIKRSKLGIVETPERGNNEK